MHFNKSHGRFLCIVKFEKHKFRRLLFDLSSYPANPVAFYLETRFLKLLPPQLLGGIENAKLGVASEP